MPVFDYKCKVCEKVKEYFVHNRTEDIICCGFPMQRLFPTRAIVNKKTHCGDIFNVDGVTLEHLPGGPKHFNSYKKLRDYAKENKLDIQAIL